MGNHLISEKKATIRMDFLNTEKANESHKNSYTLEACVHSFEASEISHKNPLPFKDRIKQFEAKIEATSNETNLRKPRRAEGIGSRRPSTGSPTREPRQSRRAEVNGSRSPSTGSPTRGGGQSVSQSPPFHPFGQAELNKNNDLPSPAPRQSRPYKEDKFLINELVLRMIENFSEKKKDFYTKVDLKSTWASRFINEVEEVTGYDLSMFAVTNDFTVLELAKTILGSVFSREPSDVNRVMAAVRKSLNKHCLTIAKLFVIRLLNRLSGLSFNFSSEVGLYDYSQVGRNTNIWAQQFIDEVKDLTGYVIPRN